MQFVEAYEAYLLLMTRESTIEIWYGDEKIDVAPTVADAKATIDSWNEAR